MGFDPLSRSPRLEEVITFAIERGAADLRVALPGKIHSYDATTQKASVKPLVQRLTATQDGKGLLEPIPIINDVPVIFPRSGAFFMSFPLAVDDCVLLIFNDASIDNYMIGKIKGEDVNPDDFRTHSLSDAVCLPGFYPFLSALKQADTTDMTLGKDDGGIQIHLTPGGTVDVKFGGGTAGKSAAVAENLQTFYNSFKALYDAHVHPTGVGPSGPPAAPAPTWDNTIASTKLKLES